MSAFRDVYVKTIYKSNAEERLIQIGFLINETIAAMAMTIDPAKWNALLDQKEALEIEEQNIKDTISNIALIGQN